MNLKWKYEKLSFQSAFESIDLVDIVIFSFSDGTNNEGKDTIISSQTSRHLHQMSLRLNHVTRIGQLALNYNGILEFVIGSKWLCLRGCDWRHVIMRTS
jgi:hypothetical protein